MKKKLTIIYSTSEIAPYSKTGGLADVAYSLPYKLASFGHKTYVFSPYYKCVAEQNLRLKNLDSLKIVISNKEIEVKLLELKKTKNFSIIFIKNNAYFYRDELYTTNDGDYPDNNERFLLFTKSVFKAVKKIGIKGDIYHFNDWQTSIGALYHRIYRKTDKFYRNSASVLTIHNLAFQGIFWKYDWHLTNLPAQYFSIDALEYYNNINLLKGGILYSDIVTTVSKKYAEEIQAEQFGFGLEGVLKQVNYKLKGILNGADYNIWNPKTDKLINKNYDIKTIEKKEENKKHLLRQFKLKYNKNIPVFGMVTRLTEQKGIDLIISLINNLMKLNIYLIILGTGEKRYEAKLKNLEKKINNLRVYIGFDEVLAHKIEAGSDFYLMPSKFEPCGLNQIYSLKYGTIPVVYSTGGLEDTIIKFDKHTLTGTGFKFDNYTKQALLRTIKESIELFKDKVSLKKIRINGMKQNFSWLRSAKEYEEMYYNLLNKEA